MGEELVEFILWSDQLWEPLSEAPYSYLCIPPVSPQVFLCVLLYVFCAALPLDWDCVNYI